MDVHVQRHCASSGRVIEPALPHSPKLSRLPVSAVMPGSRQAQMGESKVVPLLEREAQPGDAPVLLMATYRDEALTATDPLRIAVEGAVTRPPARHHPRADLGVAARSRLR